MFQNIERCFKLQFKRIQQMAPADERLAGVLRDLQFCCSNIDDCRRRVSDRSEDEIHPATKERSTADR